MSLRTVVRQRTFAGGQLDEKAGRRDDTPIFSAALKRAKNLQPLPSGACRRRPGRKVVYFGEGRKDFIQATAADLFDIRFYAFLVEFSQNGVVTDLVGGAWTDDMLPDIQWWAHGKSIYVVHRDMKPVVLSYDGSTWTSSQFAFRTAPNGRSQQPFYRLRVPGATMSWTSSGSAFATGTTVSLSCSEPFFTNGGQVGSVIRWAGRQIYINSISVAMNTAQGVALENLPPTVQVTVGASPGTAGYVVGEYVVGSDSGIQGIVISVDSATTLTILITSRFFKGYVPPPNPGSLERPQDANPTGDDGTGAFVGFAANEVLTSEAGQGVVASNALVASAATIDWDEGLMSDFNGWPGSVTVDRERLIFSDFGQLEGAIVESAVGYADVMEVTGAADAAIFEIMPTACRVLGVLGGSDQFVFTDRGVYYIPISADTPLSPGSVEFRLITTDAIAEGVRPQPGPDGPLFVSKSGNRVIAITGTGQSGRGYVAGSLTDLHSDLFTNIVSLAVSNDSNDETGERYVYAVNDDGTVVAGRYDRSLNAMGWFPWDSVAAITQAFSLGGVVKFAGTYTIDGSPVYTVEEQDADRRMDGMIDLTKSMSVWNSATLLANLDGASMSKWRDDVFYEGEVDVGASGVAIADDGYDSLSLGFTFDVDLAPLIPSPDSGQNVKQRLRRRKPGKGTITVRDTQEFNVGNRTFASYIGGEDTESDRPLRDNTYAFRVLGRSWDPDVPITQTVPGGFNMIELTFEITP